MNPGPRPRGLLDTSVVIDYRNAEPAAVQLLNEIRLSRFPEFSQVTALVIVTQCKDGYDLGGVDTLLALSTVLTLTAKIAERALRILLAQTPPTSLSADDAIVAATAIVHKLPLYTLDPARFAAVPGLSAVRPY